MLENPFQLEHVKLGTPELVIDDMVVSLLRDLRKLPVVENPAPLKPWIRLGRSVSVVDEEVDIEQLTKMG